MRLTSPPAGAVCYKHSTSRPRSRRSQRALIIAHAYELFIPRTADYIAKIFLYYGKIWHSKIKRAAEGVGQKKRASNREKEDPYKAVSNWLSGCLAFVSGKNRVSYFRCFQTVKIMSNRCTFLEWHCVSLQNDILSINGLVRRIKWTTFVKPKSIVRLDGCVGWLNNQVYCRSMATMGLAPLPSKKKAKTHERLLRLIWSVIWDMNKNQQANSVDLKKK